MSGWSESWRTGNDRLDSEHAELFTLIEVLHRAIGEGRPCDASLLDRAETCMTTHFRYEHDLMRRSLCPSMVSHDRYHAQLTDALAVLRQAWERGSQEEAQIACAAFRDQFIFHQDTGADREMLRHLKTCPVA